MGYDLLVVVKEGTLNNAASAIYDKVHQSLFTGNTTMKFMDKDWKVSWDVQSSPTLNLSEQALDESPNLISEYLDIVKTANENSKINLAEDQIRQVIKNGGSHFVVNLSKVLIHLEGDGEKLDETISASVMCTISSNGNGEVVFSANSITMTSQDKIFQWFLDNKVKAETLNSIKEFLNGIKVPKIGFDGLTFGKNTVGIDSGCVGNAACLEGGIAALPEHLSVPKGNGFYLAISENIVKTYFDRWWNKEPKTKNLSPIPNIKVGVDLEKYNFHMNNSISVGVNASGRIDAYLVITPSWSVSISEIKIDGELKMDGNKIDLSINAVHNPEKVSTGPANFAAGLIDIFTLLAPELIINSVIQNEIAPNIKKAINNVTIYNIPTIYTSVKGVPFSINPNNLHLEISGSQVTMSGNLDVSSATRKFSLSQKQDEEGMNNNNYETEGKDFTA